MFRNKKTTLLLLAVVLTSIVEVANADFTFGEPTNLGATVNSSAGDVLPSITVDGLTLYFSSNRSGGSGGEDIWVTTRTTTSESWGEPVNLGPTVNTTHWEFSQSISADDLTLYFMSTRPGGTENADIWVTTRATTSDPWDTPVNLGPTVNSSSIIDWTPSISADGLELYFASERPGEYGGGDIYVATRATTSDPWGTPVNLGIINSRTNDTSPSISADGRMLFFQSTRSGGSGGFDIWVTTWETTNAEWSAPVNLGPPVNSSNADGNPCISADGSTLFFWSSRAGGIGGNDLWQAPIEPVVDLNNDGIVDADDMCIIVDNWGTDDPLCDIGPMPWGDGIVDVQDLIVLAEHLFEEVPDDMAYIPDGEFEMGDHHGDGYSHELPIHAVFLDSFFISKFEITNLQYCDYLNSAYDAREIKVDRGYVYSYSDASNSYQYCLTHNASDYNQIDYNDVSGTFSVRTKGEPPRDMSNDPLVMVSWYGSAAYCNWRSDQEGYETCYNLSTWDCDFSKKGYRLPTEAEWEYAARGGLSGKGFPWADPNITHSQANYYSTASYPYDITPTRGSHPAYNDGIYPYTAPVGSFSANGYGLYDMSGNVWEWCNDWWNSTYYSTSPYDNPQGPVSGPQMPDIGPDRVLRGGGWEDSADECRVANRGRNFRRPDIRCSSRGFRVALD